MGAASLVRPASLLADWQTGLLDFLTPSPSGISATLKFGEPDRMHVWDIVLLVQVRCCSMKSGQSRR